MDLGFLIPAVLLYAILMVLRFKTGARVYNLFGVGILVFLSIQYKESLPMVITFSGLVLYSLWDTFAGGNNK